MKHPATRLARLLLPLIFCLLAGAPRAEPIPFQTWLDDFRKEAAQQGIRESTLNAALSGLEPINRVLEADRKQPEFLDTFLDYLNKRVNDSRLRAGQDKLSRYADLLADIERRYGIPAPYLLAFWGLETNYGAYLGDTPVFAALATLAHDARRPGFFRQQLLDALRILDQGQLAVSDLNGSWAGALGHMQFIPSTWLAYAIDGDNDGRIDLRGSIPDAFHSAANYLRKAGWRVDEGWGMEVRLPAGFDPAHANLKRRKPVNTWSFLGIKRADGSRLPDSFLPASLVLPQGVDGPAFLVQDNFRVIMRWNRSIHYALAVGHLADRLAGAPPLMNGVRVDNRRISREQLETLQQALAALGFDPGPADGVAGANTREAIRAYQTSVGLPPDGYPSAKLLEHLQNTLLKAAQPTSNDSMSTTDND